jgi:hypothetical protein
MRTLECARMIGSRLRSMVLAHLNALASAASRSINSQPIIGLRCSTSSGSRQTRTFELLLALYLASNEMLLRIDG